LALCASRRAAKAVEKSRSLISRLINRPSLFEPGGTLAPRAESHALRINSKFAFWSVLLCFSNQPKVISSQIILSGGSLWSFEFPLGY
jgi:hypothetical protein